MKHCFIFLNRVVCSMVLLALTVGATGVNYTWNNVQYTLQGDSAIALKVVDETIEELILPETVTYEDQSYELRTVASYAFDDLPNLERVVLPNTITHLCRSAFGGCKQLSEVTLPSGLLTMEANVFGECSSLESVVVPSTLKVLGEMAFTGCSSLRRVVLPEGVERIGTSAFYGCVELDSIVLPSTIKYIDGAAFRNCQRLRSFVLLGATPPVLEDVYSLESVHFFRIPEGAAEAYLAAPIWEDKVLLAGEGVSVEVTLPVAGMLGELVLLQTENLFDVNRLKVSGELNDADFYHIQHSFPQLSEIDMSGVTNEDFPDYMFAKRHGLIKAIVPNGLKSLGHQCFDACHSLIEVELPEGLVDAGEYAFRACWQLKSVLLPSTLPKLTYEMFSDCISLESIVIPDGVDAIDPYCFRGCVRLDSVTFSLNLLTIASDAFRGCSSLSSIVLPEKLTSIAGGAFGNCANLTECVLPASLEYMDRSFSQCPNLRKVICHASVPPMMYDSQNMFYRSDVSDVELYVPYWACDTYKLAEGWGFPTILPLGYEPDFIHVPGELLVASDVRFTDKPVVKVWKEGRMTVRGADPLSMTRYTQHHYLGGRDYLYQSYSENHVYTAMLSESGAMRADTVECVLKAGPYIWHFIVPPFDVKRSDIRVSNDALFVIRAYDGKSRGEATGEANWKDVAMDATLEAGVGYILQVNKETELLLQAVNNGVKNRQFAGSDLEFVMQDYPSEFPHNSNWNFLGNPYPCYYDIAYLAYRSPITVWDIKQKTYVAYSPEDDEYVLRPMQAFFVQKPTEVSDFVFEMQGRQVTDAIRQRMPVRQAANASQRALLNLYLSNDVYQDRARIVLNECASRGYDVGVDAAKFMSHEPNVPQLYVVGEGGQRYAICETPEGDGVFRLGYQAGEAGEYTLSLDASVATEIELHDRVTGATTRIDLDTYTFSTEAGTFIDRFELHTNISTGLDELTDKAHDVVLTSMSRGMIIKAPLRSQVAIYNVAGAMLWSETMVDSVVEVDLPVGAYLITVDDAQYKAVVTH